MVFPLVAVTWNADFAILGVRNLSFYMPGASIFYPGDIRGDHGRTHGSPEADFYRF